MFSFVAGRNGERISTKPIRAQMKTPLQNALTLGYTQYLLIISATKKKEKNFGIFEPN